MQPMDFQSIGCFLFLYSDPLLLGKGVLTDERGFQNLSLNPGLDPRDRSWTLPQGPFVQPNQRTASSCTEQIPCRIARLMICFGGRNATGKTAQRDWLVRALKDIDFSWGMSLADICVRVTTPGHLRQYL